MDLLRHALRATPSSIPPHAPARDALVIGAGGPLGSAVLERALARGGLTRVMVATVEPVAPALRGFVAWPLADLQHGTAPLPPLAFVVFDRERRSNGRDDAFHRPLPQELPELAARLRSRGVRRLVLVQPQDWALLPQALRAGLASLDEAALAAQGFDHLVLLRAAGTASDVVTVRPLPQRLARWMLTQLRWMVPQRDQPVRAATLAALAVALARALPSDGTSRTHVVPPDLAWHAAQTRDVDSLAADWLAGRGLPSMRVAPPRM